MKKACLVLIVILAVAGFAMAQDWSSPTDVLGAHNNGGRGCAGCHSPHSGAYGSGHTPKGNTADTGTYALWGQDASPLYGATLSFGDSGRFVEVLPATITGGGTETNILLCLSCHDGNLTYSNMMTNYSYEQKVGLLTNTAYGSSHIPTLLGAPGSGAANPYWADHPVGLNATISTTTNGLVWANNAFSVTAGTQFAQFVANYGWPALAPGAHGNPYGLTAGGKPFVSCTTCHNQHVMTVYTSSSKSQIANDGGGKFYATYFFVNGPYNPNVTLASAQVAPSTTQFCRECHFGEANEANNTNNITTQFQ